MRVPNPDDDVCRKTRQAKEKKKSEKRSVRWTSVGYEFKLTLVYTGLYVVRHELVAQRDSRGQEGIARDGEQRR